MPLLHPEQKRIFQSMTAEQKLDIALKLYHSAMELKVAGLQSQYPDLDEEKIREKAREIFLHARA